MLLEWLGTRGSLKWLAGLGKSPETEPSPVMIFQDSSLPSPKPRGVFTFRWRNRLAPFTNKPYRNVGLTKDSKFQAKNKPPFTPFRFSRAIRHACFQIRDIQKFGQKNLLFTGFVMKRCQSIRHTCIDQGFLCWVDQEDNWKDSDRV